MDKWLWATRFFKTRAIAVKACELGRVKSNGQLAKPAREVKAGDRLEITTDGGVYRDEVLLLDGPLCGQSNAELDGGLYSFEVLLLSDERGPAATAQTLYAESTESREARAKAQEERKSMLAFERLPALKPTGRDRRQLSRLRGRG